MTDRLRFTSTAKLDPLVRELIDQLAPLDLTAWQRMGVFANSVSKMLSFVADTLNPQKYDDFVAYAKAWMKTERDKS